MLNEYHNAIRAHIDLIKRRGKQHELRHYQVQEDETGDASLVSYRVYGSRDYADVIRVACGVSYVHEMLPVKAIYLPTLASIRAIKKRYGVD